MIHLDRRGTDVAGAQRQVVVVRLEHPAHEAGGDALGDDDEGDAGPPCR